MISSSLASGKVKMQVYPLNCGRRIAGRESRRPGAANAFATVANSDPDHALAFYEALFENEPDENTSGLTDQQIADGDPGRCARRRGRVFTDRPSCHGSTR